MTNAARASTTEHLAPLLRTAEVARLLGMSREQVWRLWSAGRLPGYKIDRYLRFSPADIERFLEQHYSASMPEIVTTDSEPTARRGRSKRRGTYTPI